jgi:hypothetical protein
MHGKRIFHFGGSGFKDLKQIAMPAFEVLKDVGELAGGRVGIEGQDPIDDMVRPGFVGGIEVARFGRRLERPHDHSGWIWSQIEGLTIQEREL